MQIGHRPLVLQASVPPTGAMAEGADHTIWLSSTRHTTPRRELRAALVGPRTAWGEERSIPGPNQFAGSCPKCGKKKVRKKPGRDVRSCPRCGPIGPAKKGEGTNHGRGRG